MTQRLEPYIPAPLTIEEVRLFTERERLFVLSTGDGLDFCPGQFLMVGLPGFGEAPISVASSPLDSRIELCIRSVGNLTATIHRLGAGNRLWARGPFGRGFPTDRMADRDILFVAGGIGLAPLRSLIRYILYGGSPKRRRLVLLYGAKSPTDMLFTDEFGLWKKGGLDIFLTVDNPSEGWKGNVGTLIELIKGLPLRLEDPLCCVVGPPVMYRPVVDALRGFLSIDGDDIYLSFERRMKCGIGRCGHCQINSLYLCEEGPVMRLTDALSLPEAI